MGYGFNGGWIQWWMDSMVDGLMVNGINGGWFQW